MFERFTEKAIKVIMLAQEEARRLGHNFVGTEQVLLGLIGEGTGIGPKVLKSMGPNCISIHIDILDVPARPPQDRQTEICFHKYAETDRGPYLIFHNKVFSSFQALIILIIL